MLAGTNTFHYQPGSEDSVPSRSIALLHLQETRAPRMLIDDKMLEMARMAAAPVLVKGFASRSLDLSSAQTQCISRLYSLPRAALRRQQLLRTRTRKARGFLGGLL